MGGPHRAVSDFSFIHVLFCNCSHLYSMQGDLILAMTYGYEVCGREDRMVEAPREMTELGSATALPGALLINDLPFRV